MPPCLINKAALRGGDEKGKKPMRLKTLGLAVSALALVASASRAETPTGLDSRGHMVEVANVNAAGFDLVRL
jgi:hypothetical protein